MFYSLLCFGRRTKKKQKKGSVNKENDAIEDLFNEDRTPSRAYTPLRPGKIYPMPTPLRDLVSAHDHCTPPWQ